MPVYLQQKKWFGSEAKELQEVKFQSIKNNLLKQVATASLKQFVISCAMVGITCAFTTSYQGLLTLGLSTGTTLALSVAGRCLNAVFYFEKAQLEDLEQLSQKYRGIEFTEEDASRKKIVDKGIKVLNYFAPVQFGALANFSADTLIHESGHTGAAEALFHHANAHLSLTPTLTGDVSGVTTYSTSGNLTGLGELFGRHASRMIVAGAGTGASFLTSLISIVVAHKIRKTHPEASRALKCMAIANIAGNIFYALSTFWTSSKDTAHDFVHLASGGVNPIVAVVFMVAIPLIVRGGMALADYIKEQKAQKSVAAETRESIACSAAED